MRAARLLHMLMLLQDRGRQSCTRLAEDLEVSRRTILRDIDALTEAGLPIIVYRGASGGVELGFDYRTRLTGLDGEEADAMAVLLADVPAMMHDLNLSDACRRAQAKMREAFPEQTRVRMTEMTRLFPLRRDATGADPRRAAMARAVRHGLIVRLRATSPAPIVVHPVALTLSSHGDWSVRDGQDGREWPESGWDDINISAISRRAGFL